MVVAHANSLRGTYVSAVEWSGVEWSGVCCPLFYPPPYSPSFPTTPHLSFVLLASLYHSLPYTSILPSALFPPFSLLFPFRLHPPFTTFFFVSFHFHTPSYPPSYPSSLLFYYITGIVKHIDGLNTEQIQKIGIPNGIPLVYKFDKSMRPIVQPKAVAPLSGEYLEKKV
jgi:hypothetical protein